MKDDAERARECLGKLVAESGRYSSVASHAFSTQGRDIFILASDAIELAVAFTQQPGGWRPIETAPKDGEPILIWKPNERMVGEWRGDGPTAKALRMRFCLALIAYRTAIDSTRTQRITSNISAPINQHRLARRGALLTLCCRCPALSPPCNPRLP